MKTHGKSPPDKSPPDKSRNSDVGESGAIDAREWDAQQRAIGEERRSADPSSHDERVAQYRLVARALRHPPLDPVPADFAAQLAARAGAPPRSADERFETLLLRGLLTLLAASATVVAAMYGAGWMQAVVAALPASAIAAAGTAVNWGVALLVCVGLSWALEQLCRREATSA